MEEMRKSSESCHATQTPSFWSLPDDLALNILARISRIHHPSLSLVSKSFRSLLSSPELDATRTLIGKPEDCIYLYLKCHYVNPKRHYVNLKPRWFTLSPTPGQKLIPMPMPLFPYEHPEHPAVVSTGSHIYLIGGTVKGTRSRKVYALDCRRHQWRMLPDMRLPRKNPTAGVIDEKIYLCV
ncbi:unnamed protein product [Microthlaspi erraticum]|uniref:F-box domain-containing protein n=1 Tax=Microthlaspi erraticum TaxID=1685480 RepID=A0A6D2J011_9BRAS|nr:unnamed protein product [Microthlaspi erraticum]CAA7036259.1 unnamed protein product [Microthlaspi erraticum]